MWLCQKQFLYLEDIYAEIFRDEILADHSQMVESKRVFGVCVFMIRQKAIMLYFNN